MLERLRPSLSSLAATGPRGEMDGALRNRQDPQLDLHPVKGRTLSTGAMMQMCDSSGFPNGDRGRSDVPQVPMSKYEVTHKKRSILGKLDYSKFGCYPHLRGFRPLLTHKPRKNILMKTRINSIWLSAVAVVGLSLSSTTASAQIAAFQTATPNAVFGTSRVPTETVGFSPAVTYKADAKGVSMRLDVAGMVRGPIYNPIALGDGHIIGIMPTATLPADVAPVTIANRRPTTTKGGAWRFAIYTNVAQANAAIAAWANLGRGAAVLTPTAAQDRVLQFVDTQLIEWIDPAFDPLAPAAGSLVGFNYTTAKNPFFTTAYLTGKVIVIYGPARTNTAAKTGANAQSIGYQTRDAYWVTPALR